MSRYYLCNLLEDPWGEGSIVPAVAYHPGLSFSGSPPCDPVTGIPYQVWSLVEVTAGDQSPLLLDPRIDPLPQGMTTTPVGILNPDEMASLRAALDRRGVGAGIISQAATLGEIVAAIQLRANAPGVVPAIASLDL